MKWRPVLRSDVNCERPLKKLNIFNVFRSRVIKLILETRQTQYRLGKTSFVYLKIRQTYARGVQLEEILSGVARLFSCIYNFSKYLQNGFITRTSYDMDGALDQISFYDLWAKLRKNPSNLWVGFFGPLLFSNLKKVYLMRGQTLFKVN